MPRLVPPCKGCGRRIVGENRDTGCHSHCEEYKRFQEASAKNKEEYQKSLIWEKYRDAMIKKQKRKNT